MNKLNNNKGFTLIELILVIAILGILAVAVAPQFVNIQANAQTAQANGTAGAVRDGINMNFAQTLATTGTGTFPATLDGAADGACAVGNECFDTVLQNGIAENWTKAGLVYTHTGSGLVCTYDGGVDGTFTCI